MKVIVNGVETDVKQDAVIADAVAAVRSDPSRPGIAVALNGSVVPRSSWDETPLSDSDSVEILTAVAGG